jgi:hypothetical protein
MSDPRAPSGTRTLFMFPQVFPLGMDYIFTPSSPWRGPTCSLYGVKGILYFIEGKM